MKFHLLPKLLIIALEGVTLNVVAVQDPQTMPPLPWYFRENFDETGRPLPPGVPKQVDTNGKTVFIPRRFTTDAYQKTALNLVLQEANKVAAAMRLPEDLPITKTNLVEYHISPFGFAYANQKIGFVTTENYVYYVSRCNKFNEVGVANYDQTCLKLQKQRRLPLSKIDTNAAYQLATQWLAAASMDVAGLNRDCKVHVDVSPFWNGLVKLGERPKKQFVPIYYVSWMPLQKNIQLGDTAHVELYLPTKSILQLSVEDPKYILRKPLVFTNLADLFPGVATIRTNYPVPPVYMSAPPP